MIAALPPCSVPVAIFLCPSNTVTDPVGVVPGALTCTVSVACFVLLTLFGATVFEVFETALPIVSFFAAELLPATSAELEYTAVSWSAPGGSAVPGTVSFFLPPDSEPDTTVLPLYWIDTVPVGVRCGAVTVTVTGNDVP